MAGYLLRQATQKEQVRLLYRRALKDTLNWAVHRHLFYQDASDLRDRFEANRHVISVWRGMGDRNMIWELVRWLLMGRWVVRACLSDRTFGPEHYPDMYQKFYRKIRMFCDAHATLLD